MINHDYYEPEEKPLWTTKCRACGWESDELVLEQCDLTCEECEECGSSRIIDIKVWR